MNSTPSASVSTSETPPAINAGRLKHLEMIQAVITRMAGNSFLIKGWSITLLAALLTLALKDKVYSALWAACVANLGFWYLDAFFLRQERLYRELWDAKRVEPQDSPTDFNMSTKDCTTQVAGLWGTAFSSTLRTFHGMLLLLLIVLGAGGLNLSTASIPSSAPGAVALPASSAASQSPLPPPAASKGAP